ncbi:hypothetical protein D5F01_LYC24303 [Larimichthys crocea]|uniref:Uncharacterized protein n=1 Tax=Larimichthys crocea TaxID=215358 RepID=A0A6G0HET2_LARCR|nr:hypothetical protein D5F01_LYC24303 [Larimichthys crocea]
MGVVVYAAESVWTDWQHIVNQREHRASSCHQINLSRRPTLRNMQAEGGLETAWKTAWKKRLGGSNILLKVNGSQASALIKSSKPPPAETGPDSETGRFHHSPAAQRLLGSSEVAEPPSGRRASFSSQSASFRSQSASFSSQSLLQLAERLLQVAERLLQVAEPPSGRRASFSSQSASFRSQSLLQVAEPPSARRASFRSQSLLQLAERLLQLAERLLQLAEPPSPRRASFSSQSTSFSSQSLLQLAEPPSPRRAAELNSEQRSGARRRSAVFSSCSETEPGNFCTERRRTSSSIDAEKQKEHLI